MKLNRRRFLTCCVLVSAGAAVARPSVGAPSSTASGLGGRIKLEGKPPPEKLVDLTDYQDVARAYPGLIGKLSTRHYVVAPDGGLANVFVYVKKGLEGQQFPVSPNQPLLDQVNAGFYPYVLGVQVNQTLLIRNSEPYLESPQSESKLNKPFSLAQPITGMVSKYKFEQPEVLVRVKCGIHPWEFAFIGAVAHPFFAVSGPDGHCALPTGLPAGQYTMEAVHPKAGCLTREITVAEGDQKLIDFAFEVPMLRK